MAVIGNTASAIGDIIYIYTQGAVAGAVSLTSYTDVVNGETLTRYFDRQFRYSLDGLNYTAWQPLTNPNIASVSGSVTSLLFMEFRYERVGTDPTGILEFVSITLDGNIIIQVGGAPQTAMSIFQDLANSDALTAAICNNLLKKIYKAGILPQYIERGPGYDDTDFVSLWSAICCYLAFVSAFADEFDSILYKRKYLKQYIVEKGLFVCAEEILFSELQFLANNFYDEIRKRGTQLTYKKIGTTLQDGSVTTMDGEWLRLICRNRYDEFLVDVVEKEKHGWCMGHSSPIYNGNYKSKQINKTQENTSDILDLSLYSIENLGNVSLTTDGTLNVASLVGDGTSNPSGFGFNMPTPPTLTVPDNLIIVDKEMDYEVTFQVKRKPGTTGTLYFGVHGYNRNAVYKPLSFFECDGLLIQNDFFVDALNETTLKEDTWYSIRGVIYAADSQLITNPKYVRTNLIGKNLRFNGSEDIDMLLPYIQVEGGVSDEWLIHDFKMRPLIKGKNLLPTSTLPSGVKNPQFLQGDGLVINWLKNNSDGRKDEEVQNRIQDYLLPYEQKLIPIFLSPKLSDKQLLL